MPRIKRTNVGGYVYQLSDFIRKPPYVYTHYLFILTFLNIYDIMFSIKLVCRTLKNNKK